MVILVLFTKVGLIPLKHRHLIKTYMVWTLLHFSPSLLDHVVSSVIMIIEQQRWQSMLHLDTVHLEAEFCFVIHSRSTLYLKMGTF